MEKKPLTAGWKKKKAVCLDDDLESMIFWISIVVGDFEVNLPLPSLKQTVRTCKWLVGILISF